MSILSEFRFTKPDSFTFGEMINSRGQKIRTGHIDAPNAKGTILLLAGLSEFTEKYYETIRDLLARGFSVRTFDWISQGGSGRTLPDEPHKIHITDFTHYLDDLKQYIAEHLSNTPFYIMAHSMGGHLTLRHLTEENSDHSNVMGAMLSAPMLSIKALPKMFRGTLRWPVIRNRIERESLEFTVGTIDWHPDKYRAGEPGKSDFSSDPIRDQLQREFLLANANLRTGGPTNGWVLAAIDSLDVLERNLTSRGLKTPTLVCLPTDDRVVNTAESKTILASTKADQLHIVELDGAKHEILVECDKYRGAFLQNFDQFIANKPQFSL